VIKQKLLMNFILCCFFSITLINCSDQDWQLVSEDNYNQILATRKNIDIQRAINSPSISSQLLDGEISTTGTILGEQAKKIASDALFEGLLYAGYQDNSTLIYNQVVTESRYKDLLEKDSISFLIMLGLRSTTNENLSTLAKNILTKSLKDQKSYNQYVIALQEGLREKAVKDKEKAAELQVAADKNIEQHAIRAEIIVKNPEPTKPTTSTEIAIGPLAVRGVETVIIGQTAEQLYDTHKDNKEACAGLNVILKPASVRKQFQDWLKYGKEHAQWERLISGNQNLKNKAPALQPKKVEPKIFGAAWFVDRTIQGNKQDITFTRGSSEWEKLIEGVKVALKPTWFERLTSYKVVTAIAKNVEKVAQTIVNSLKKNNLYPMPILALNDAFDATYTQLSDGTFKVNDNQEIKNLADSSNVELLKSELLKLYVGIDFGTYQWTAKEQVSSSDILPQEFIAKLVDWYQKNKNGKIDSITFISSAITAVGIADGFDLMTGSPSIKNTATGDLIKFQEIKELIETAMPSGTSLEATTSAGISKKQYDAFKKTIDVKNLSAEDLNDPLLKALSEKKSYEEYMKLPPEEISTSAYVSSSKSLVVENIHPIITEKQYNNGLFMIKSAQSQGKSNMAIRFAIVSIVFNTEGITIEDEALKESLIRSWLAQTSYSDFVASLNSESIAIKEGVDKLQEEAKTPTLVLRPRKEQSLVVATPSDSRINLPPSKQLEAQIGLGRKDEKVAEGEINKENELRIAQDKKVKELFKKAYDMSNLFLIKVLTNKVKNLTF